jgi:hypothetical protein
MLCTDFNTKECYIDGRLIKINEYIGGSALCKYNHLLVYVNAKKTPHFRHKNVGDCGNNNMTSWHYNWQLRFDDIEIPFEKKVNSIKKRYADVVVSDKVLEFQHSSMNEKEVLSRKNDYSLHDKDILWMIDGCNQKILTTTRDTFIIVFNNVWKYESYMSYDRVYIECNDYVYMFNPNLVKSNMTEVTDRKTTAGFVTELKEDRLMFNDVLLTQSIIYYNQRGAGCGKTYESIGLIQHDKRFNHVNTFIYLTKMHSARHTIYKEFKDQLESKSITLECELNTEENNENKYQILIFTKGETTIRVVISTVDSFMYALHNPDEIKEENDKFAAIVKSIGCGHIDKSEYRDCTLSKECLIITDETQDLHLGYLDAFYEISRSTYCDIYMIGDKLQSILEPVNIYTHIKGKPLHNIEIIESKPNNKVRRFHNEGLSTFVNKVVPFGDFNLPSIGGICDGKCEFKHNKEPCVEIFQAKGYNPDHSHITPNITEIMTRVKKEVDDNNYTPDNFMFIFPNISKNPVVKCLLSALNEFWHSKFNDKEYLKIIKNYVESIKDDPNVSYNFTELHKSDEGTSIDLSTSEKKSRILSVHSSKGTGREVVFVLMSESDLMCHKTYPGDLKYESMFHVSVTRMKSKLYFGYEVNDDNICKRVSPYDKNENTIFIPNINRLRNTPTGNPSDDNDMFTSVYEDYIKNIYECSFDNESNKIIDMGHHTIRYVTFIHYFKLFCAFDKFRDDDQFITRMRIVGRSVIQSFKNKDYYDEIKKKKDRNKNNEKKDTRILVLQYNNTDSRAYYYYHKHIIRIMKNIQKKIDLNNKNCTLFCPLECVVYVYMVEISNGFVNEISIDDIYKYIDIMSYQYKSEDHKDLKCECDIIFPNKQCVKGAVLKNMEALLKSSDMSNQFIKKITGYNKEYKYNVDHMVIMHKDQYMLKKNMKLIAYSSTHVINVIFKNTLSSINFNNTIVDAMYDTYLISHTTEDKNMEKYYNKKIITCILSIDSGEMEFYEFPVIPHTYVRDWIYRYNILNHIIIHRYITAMINQATGSYINFVNKICVEFKKKDNYGNNIISSYIQNYIEGKSSELRTANDIEKKIIYGYIKNVNTFNEDITETLKYDLDRAFDLLPEESNAVF